MVKAATTESMADPNAQHFARYQRFENVARTVGGNAVMDGHYHERSKNGRPRSKVPKGIRLAVL